MNINRFCGLFFGARNFRISIMASLLLISPPALAQFTGLSGCSQEFYRDVIAAERKVNEEISVEPVVALQKRYTNELERVSLEISIGLDYNQRTGVVNPTNAAVHFTAALNYDNLPEQTRMQILLWRGNSLEEMGKSDEALKDYLRGLLECSYYDLSGGWPEILQPKAAIDVKSPNPEDPLRAGDNFRYWRHVDFTQFLLRQRYFLIDAVKRLQRGKSNDDILDVLKSVSPDFGRNKKIIELLKSDNKQPWP
jgi:hypothetical protein